MQVGMWVYGFGVMSKIPVFSYLGPLKIVRSRKSIEFWEYFEVNLIEG